MCHWHACCTAAAGADYIVVDRVRKIYNEGIRQRVEAVGDHRRPAGRAAELRRLCRSLMMSRLKMFLTMKFPFALPHIFSGLRIGVTFALIGGVLGEFITAQTELGYIILFSANNFETALLLAAILLPCGVGIVLFALFLALETIVMRLHDSR